MVVAETSIYTNSIQTSGYRSVSSDPRELRKLRAGVPVTTPSASATATSPSILPRATADCFDSEFQEPVIVFQAPMPVFLDFDEFDGLAARIPLPVSVEYHKGLCEVEHPELGIFGRGETCEEAVVDFLEYLVADYRAYAEESEENLDSQARALADRYRMLLKRV